MPGVWEKMREGMAEAGSSQRAPRLRLLGRPLLLGSPRPFSQGLLPPAGFCLKVRSLSGDTRRCLLLTATFLFPTKKDDSKSLVGILTSLNEVEGYIVLLA